MVVLTSAYMLALKRPHILWSTGRSWVRNKTSRIVDCKLSRRPVVVDVVDVVVILELYPLRYNSYHGTEQQLIHDWEGKPI